MKPALLIIDMQKTYRTEENDSSKTMAKAAQYINAVAELFREKQLPIVAIYHHHLTNGPEQDDECYQMIDEIKIPEPDLVIHKNYGSSFHKTELFDNLQQLGVDTLIITGFCAEYCVLSTCKGAADLGFKRFVLINGLGSMTKENIGFVERIEPSITYTALNCFLN